MNKARVLPRVAFWSVAALTLAAVCLRTAAFLTGYDGDIGYFRSAAVTVVYRVLCLCIVLIPAVCGMLIPEGGLSAPRIGVGRDLSASVPLIASLITVPFFLQSSSGKAVTPILGAVLAVCAAAHFLLALLGVGSGVGAMMSGKLIDKHGVKPVLAMGFIGVAIGSIFMAFVACTWPSLLTVCATMIITGLGLGFTMGTPLNYMMLENTDEKESNSALAALSLVRSIGTAIAPAIMVAFVVHASAYLQGNLMDAMPSEVSVSELPHAAELDSELASLRETENGAKMLEGVDIPSLEDYRTIDVGMDSASGDGSFEMSDETLEQLKNSDVTTVVSACKALSGEMFDTMKPTIEGNIQGGFDKGIASMQEGLDSMNAQMSRVPAPAAAAMAAQRDELQTVVSQMEEARDAVPAMLDEAKENYLTEVDNDAAEIQEAYQQTMNSGFKGMSLFVAACSIVGLVLLVPYKDKKRLAQSEK